MTITKNQLINICKYYMFELWEDKLQIPVEISGRLSKSLGYFKYSFNGLPIKLVFSKDLLQNYKLSTIESVIKHELCHYHLFKMKEPFADGHPNFEKELVRIGGNSTKTIHTAGMRHVCKCKKCGKIVGNYKTEAKAKSKISKCLSGCCLEELIYGGVIEIEDNSKLFEAQIKTKKLEEVLKLSSKEINDYINGDLNDSKPQETLEVANTLKEFNINDYVKVTSKKPTQGNVYDTLVILIDKQDQLNINNLLNLYEKHFNNCLKYLSKKRKNYLNQIGIIVNN